MKIIALSIIILLFGNTVLAADKWNPTDKALVATMWIARWIDMWQTLYIYDSPLYEESGPIVKQIGKEGVIPWFIGTAIVAHYVAHILPNRYRTPFLVGANIGSWGPVIHNRSAGITIPF